MSAGERTSVAGGGPTAGRAPRASESGEAGSTVALDLQGARGALISARTPLDETSARTLLVLADVARVSGAATADGIRVTVANLSVQPLRWASIVGGIHDEGIAQAGEAFVLVLPAVHAAGYVQLVVGETLAATLTLSAFPGGATMHLLGQALIGG